MTIGKIELSIIIISYNTRKITENCLTSIYDSLNTNPFSYEIIVIDNASTDGSQNIISKIKSQKSNLKTIFNRKNVGFAKANNQAVSQAKGEYILLLNSDIIVLDDAIEKLLTFYKTDTKIHFVGGKLFNKNMTPQSSCGPFYTLPIIFAALFLKGDHWGISRSSPDTTVETDWISGACILTKKDYYDSLIGFDENIFMYMDEIDLLYRSKQKGYRVFFYPEARFIHLGSASSQGKTYPILQVFKGFTYFYRKHHNDRISLFLLRIMLQLKSLVAVFIGKLSGNQYLIKTYEEAYKLTQMD